MESRTLLSITVNTFDDVVDPSDGLTSLREAIWQAEGGSDAETIVLPYTIGGSTGTYALSHGELTIDSAYPLSIRSDGGSATIDALGASRVFNVAAGSVVDFSGLTITGGGGVDLGAGLLNAGTVRIGFSTVQGNAADVGGGGIFTQPLSSTIITDSTIAGNTAVQFGGGISNAGRLEITDSALADNTASTSNGGGLDTIGDVAITRVLFRGNFAGGYGGGFSNHGVLGANGTMVVSDSTFLDNTAAANGGGFDSNGLVTLFGGLFDGNHADGFGGAIGNGGTLTVVGAVITNNDATGNAGGIFNTYTDDVYASKMDLTDVTLEYNTSLGYGGAISNWGTSTVTGGTINHNTASYGGGGIDNFTGSLAITNTSIHHNSSGYSGGGIWNYDAALSVTGGAIDHNTANGDGGGILSVLQAVSLDGVSIRGNTASYYGGGIYASSSPVTITDGAVSGNTASYGGGIYLESGTATITDGAISGNTASYYGGGIYASYSSATTVTDGAISGNTASYGGGIYNSGGSVTVAGGSITGNTAIYDGGGVHSGYGGTTNLEGATISSNSAFSGGGVYVYGSGYATITGNTIASNQGGGIATYANSNTVVASNLITNNVGDGVKISGAYNTIGIPGAGNTITGNTGAGVTVEGFSYANAIRGNVINANGGLSIDLGGDGRTANDPGDDDYGANNLQNHPIITGFVTGASTRVMGSLNSTPFTTFTIDVYAGSSASVTGPGDSIRHLGSFSVTTDVSGDVSFDRTLAVATSAGEIPTATATGPYGDTSEFSSFVPIQVTPASGLSTSESGGKATFSVVLTVEPTASVTIPLNSSNTAEGTVSRSSLTFTTANWNVPQVVTVTGVDDSVADGPVLYTILTGAATSVDPLFAGQDGPDVQVTNFDNDFAPMSAVPPVGGLIYDTAIAGHVAAGGGAEVYTISLDPGQKVTVLVTPDGTDLRPTVQLFEVGGKKAIAVATASAAGLYALIQTAATHGQLASNGPGPKSYQIRVTGADGASGSFHLRVVLNAALETESLGGAADDSRATAQSLTTAFLPLNASVTDVLTGSHPGRGAVLGRTDAGTPDYYSFTLAAGESATLALAATSFGNPSLALEDSTGATLAVGRPGATNLGQVIGDFVATRTGTYYVRVDGFGTDYSLIVTRNAAFDTEANDSIATAQDLIGSQVAGRRWAMGAVEPGPSGLYATGYEGNYLITIDPATGAGRPVGEFGTYQTYSAAFTPDGTLWTIIHGFDPYLAQLATVDRATGVATPVGSPNWTGSPILAMDADAQGNLYAGNWDGTFFRVDGTTSQMTSIGFMGFYNTMDFAFDNNGTLWALDQGMGLYTIDLATGAGTFRASISGLNGDAMGLMVDPSDNSLYVTTYTYDSNLYRVDPATGQATPVGPVGIYLPHGGDFAPLTPPKGDFYRITADANSQLEIETQTPASKAGEFANSLNPILRLYDSAGNLVASNDDGASDGLNARLTYRVPRGGGGTYYIQVTASPATPAPTSGEYILSVKQATGAPPPFQVTGTDVPDGARLQHPPSSIRVDFNDVVLLTSLSASDLLIDGRAATEFTVVDGDTVVFTLPAGLPDGVHTVTIASGAIKDVQGTNLAAFSARFTSDATPPRVVGSSIQRNDVLAPGSLAYVVTFSEAVLSTDVDSYDFALQGLLRGSSYSPSSFAFNPAGTVLTIRYDALPEDNYVLTLYSGPGRFQDLVGNILDGEAPGGAVSPANPSGDGVAGGEFVIRFSMDVDTAAYPTPLEPRPPLGSLIYEGSVSGAINSAGDLDRYWLNLAAGQTITVVASPARANAPMYGGVGNGSFNAGSLLLVGPSGSGSSLIGDPVTPGGLTGLAYDASSKVLYGSTIGGFGSASRLVRIDPATGALLETVGAITDGPGGPAISISDLAIQPGTGVLFGVRSSADGYGVGGHLYTIDKSTGVATFVGDTGSGRGGGIAFAPDGSLYQTSFNSFFDFTSLNELDPATAARISTVPISGYFDGLAIRDDGVIFATSGGPDDSIYTIDPITGGVNFVGNTGQGSTSDLAFGGPPLATTIELRDPSNTIVATATAAPGHEAVLQTVSIATAGTYTITIGGASGATDLYDVTTTLNAAVELESHGGTSNGSAADAQDIDGSFIGLLKGATRGAVLGVSGDADVYSLSLQAGQALSADLVFADADPPQLFGPRADYEADSPISVAVGDVNHDGKPDLVYAEYSWWNLAVRLGNGDGTFGAPSDFGYNSAYPQQVVLADLDGDGNLDAVASNYSGGYYGTGGVTVMLGNGDGTFATAVPYDAGFGNVGLAAADVDGDGRPEILTTSTDDSTLHILFLNGDGSLDHQDVHAVGAGPRGVAVGDLDGDGTPDIATSNFHGASVTILRNNGDGAFGPPVDVYAGDYPSGVALGDLDGDGSLDILVTSDNSQSVSVLFNDGAGGFAPWAPVFFVSSLTSASLGDVNKDGALDIVVGSNFSGIWLLLNNGDGTFGRYQNLQAPAYVNSVAIADLNADGLTDLVSANLFSYSLSVFLNQSAPSTLELIAPDGVTVLATATATDNGHAAFSNFVAPAGGTYYLRVAGPPTVRSYTLVATRDAVLDLGGNDAIATAQPLGPVHVALGHVGAADDPSDVHSFTATAGQAIELFTTSPSDGPGAFGNTLDPHIQLFDEYGTLLADGAPTRDGRNERIDYPLAGDGTYHVVVTAESGTSGEYALVPSPAADGATAWSATLTLAGAGASSMTNRVPVVEPSAIVRASSASASARAESRMIKDAPSPAAGDSRSSTTAAGSTAAVAIGLSSDGASPAPAVPSSVVVPNPALPPAPGIRRETFVSPRGLVPIGPEATVRMKPVRAFGRPAILVMDTSPAGDDRRDASSTVGDDAKTAPSAVSSSPAVSSPEPTRASASLIEVWDACIAGDEVSSSPDGSRPAHVGLALSLATFTAIKPANSPAPLRPLMVRFFRLHRQDPSGLEGPSGDRPVQPPSRVRAVPPT